MSGTIYFIQQGDNGPVKIGYTEGRVTKRLSMLQVGNPDKLHVLRIIDGTPKDEARVHVRFEDDWINGEWFEFSPALNKFIRELKDAKVKAKAKVVKLNPNVTEFNLLVKEHQKLDDLRAFKAGKTRVLLPQYNL